MDILVIKIFNEKSGCILYYGEVQKIGNEFKKDFGGVLIV